MTSRTWTKIKETKTTATFKQHSNGKNLEIPKSLEEQIHNDGVSAGKKEQKLIFDKKIKAHKKEDVLKNILETRINVYRKQETIARVLCMYDGMELKPAMVKAKELMKQHDLDAIKKDQEAMDRWKIPEPVEVQHEEDDFLRSARGNRNDDNSRMV